MTAIRASNDFSREFTFGDKSGLKSKTNRTHAHTTEKFQRNWQPNRTTLALLVAVSSKGTPHWQLIHMPDHLAMLLIWADTHGDMICGKTNELLMTVSVRLEWLEALLGVLAGHRGPVSCSLLTLWGKRCCREPALQPKYSIISIEINTKY